MHQIKHIAIFLLLLQSYTLVAGQCKLTAAEVEAETRIVAVKRGSSYELWDGDEVDLGTKLHFICADNNVVIVKCVTEKKVIKFNHTLPVASCSSPPKAKVVPINDSTCEKQTTKAYSVGYQYSGQHLELYRSCFDKTKMRAYYTVHTRSPHSIATKRPLRTSFTGDGLVTVRDATSYQARNIFERFKAILWPSQPYIISDRVIVVDRGHLVPSNDYVSVAYMEATFKYLNVMPQFTAINRGTWKSVENYIRKRIDETGKGLIVTGNFGVLKLKGQSDNQVEIYLLDNQKNAIPKWLFKKFSNEREHVVFLTYNNIFENEKPTPACREIACPRGFNSESISTFCCDPDDFDENVFPYIMSDELEN